MIYSIHTYRFLEPNHVLASGSFKQLTKEDFRDYNRALVLKHPKRDYFLLS